MLGDLGDPVRRGIFGGRPRRVEGRTDACIVGGRGNGIGGPQGRAPQSAVVERTILPTSSEGADFQVREVGIADDTGALNRAEFGDTPAGLQRIACTFLVPTTTGPWRTLLTIRTDHPGAEVLEVPVCAFISDHDDVERAADEAEAGR